MDTSSTNEALAELRGRIAGTVLVAGDDGYDAARRTWNENVEHRPAVIVRPLTASDVATAVRFARASALPIAVQSTGHGAVLPCSGLLIDTSAMTSIAIDARTEVATIGPGVTWGDFNREAHRYGLVGLAGFVPTVGVVGYSLGGGIGWFTRQFGYAAHSIVAATLVLADGTIAAVDEREHPDLLWALRGGSGNFGVVASLSFRCYRVATVYGGKLTYPIDAGREVLRRFARWSPTLPDTFTPSLTVMKMPPDPELPDALRGRTVVDVAACFNGPESEGEALMAAWSDLEPLARELGLHETSRLDAIEAGPPGALRAHSSNAELADLPDGAIDAIVAAMERESPLRMVEIRVLGGAVARSSRDGAAGDAGANYVVHVQATLDDPATENAARREVRALVDALAPFATGGVSLSFLPDGREGIELVPRAYDAETFARLTSLKTQHDPHNAFRLNYNIAPDSRSAAMRAGDSKER